MLKFDWLLECLTHSQPLPDQNMLEGHCHDTLQCPLSVGLGNMISGPISYGVNCFSVQIKHQMYTHIYIVLFHWISTFSYFSWNSLSINPLCMWQSSICMILLQCDCLSLLQPLIPEDINSQMCTTELNCKSYRLMFLIINAP